MNNSDILKYIQGYQILNKHIPETEIWNILLQCLSALNYLVSLNLGNLGIKLTNIFVNNLYNIKISIFRDINLNSQYYSQNDDIYYLSKYFYIMMSLQSFTVKQLNEKMFIDNLNTNNGFRLGFKAGVWYQDIGVSVGYNPVIGKNSGQVPIYNSLQIGVSVRY